MELRQYQREDVDYIKPLDAAGVFNEPRTGKTPTSITAVFEKLQPPYLFVVVAPASMLYKWADEIQQWSGLPAVVCKGTLKKRLKIIDEWTEGALVINYETLRDYNQKEDGVTIVRNGHYTEILKKKPQAVIVDEAHRIKSRTKITPKAVFKLSKIPYRLALTGTPAPNKQEEVWAILHFLYPKEYSSYWDWVEKHFYFGINPHGGGRAKEVYGLMTGQARVIQQELNQFCTNRKRKDIMPWLPDIPDPTRIRLPVSTLQAKYLYEMTEFFETEDVITQGVLDRIIRYRQICNAPELLGLRGTSPKIEWIKDYMSDYPDVPTIYFTRLSAFAHLIKKKTNGKVEVFDGSVDLKERQRLINRFQSGKINSLVIQIDAGKEGLTLDRAEKIIFLDQTPPAADILQAKDRFVATTEDKASIPKEIIYLMMADTYDEELYNLVEQNASDIDIINSYQKYIKGVM